MRELYPTIEGGKFNTDSQRCRNTASNYKLISLTSQLCKVFSAIVRDKIVFFLEKYKLIKFQKRKFMSKNLLFLDNM